MVGQAFGNEAFQQADILQPAAVVLGEQVAQDQTAGGLVGLDADEPGAPITGPHGGLGQHAADDMGRAVTALGQGLPDLLLAVMVGVTAKAMSCSRTRVPSA